MKYPILICLSLLALCTSFASTDAEIELPEIWEVGDGEGGKFLIALEEGNFARTNYSKGDTGFLGERGYWHRGDGITTVLYDSGWCDTIKDNDDGTFTKHGFSPNTALSAEPSNTSSANKVEGRKLFEEVNISNFIGVWKLQDESSEDFYVQIKPDGTARTTYPNGPEGVFGETGVWRHVDNHVTVLYNSGWVDVIVYGKGKFRKYAYNPTQIIAGKFDNTSDAEKIDPSEVGMRPITK
ncbi:MAG: hypothetical protein AAFX93_17315 [Verrucomicrobiota bacterium]